MLAVGNRIREERESRSCRELHKVREMLKAIVKPN